MSCRNGFSRLYQGLVLYLVVWCISPPLAYGTIYRIGAIIAMGLLIKKNINAISSKRQTYILAIIALCVIMFAEGFIVNDSFSIRLGTYISMAFLVSYICITSQEDTLLNCEWIMSAVMFLLILWNICTIRELLVNGNITRILAKNSEVSEYYSKLGVGGYGYIYSLLLFFPIMFAQIVDKKEKKNRRFISGVCLLTSIYVIYLSQYFLAMILMIVAVILYAISKNQNANVRLGLYILLFFGVLILYLNVNNIIDGLLNRIEMRGVHLKLLSIKEMLNAEGGISDSEFATRYARYVKDLNAILASPIWGGITHNVTGNHSHLLDYFAQYGIIMGIAYCKIVFLPFKMMKQQHNTVVVSTFVLWLIVNLLNASAFSFSAIVYIVLPIYCIHAKTHLVRET